MSAGTFGIDLAAPTDDADALRGAFGGFPSGIAALCARVDGKLIGMVASSFSAGVSFAPPLVMFSVQNTSSTWPLLRSVLRLGVSILAQDQEELCRQLASRNGDRFHGIDVSESSEGAVFIPEAAMWLECETLSETPAGDHHVVVLQVHRLSQESDIEPLVYHRRSFHRLRATA
jgi:flavin reductase (DIM6/NTAB) family NADH-FMN oxidoreductase RutF